MRGHVKCEGPVRKGLERYFGDLLFMAAIRSEVVGTTLFETEKFL